MMVCMKVWWRRVMMGCAVVALLPALAWADDAAAAREAVLQLGQGLQGREAARVREMLAPGVVVTVTLVEPDSTPTFSFGREEFLQTYTSLWKFSSKEKVDVTVRNLAREGEGAWVATADFREQMLVLGEAYRRESVVTCHVRKRNERFVIEAVGMRTVIR